MSRGPHTRLSFPKKRRVLRSFEFGNIIKNGRYAADDCLVVNARTTTVDSSHGRLGVTIPTKTGNAVVRNRWKRLIREAYRLEQLRLPRGYDLIVKPRKGAVPDFAKVRRSLLQLAQKVCR